MSMLFKSTMRLRVGAMLIVVISCVDQVTIFARPATQEIKSVLGSTASGNQGTESHSVQDAGMVNGEAMAKGRVFVDNDRNGKYGPGDALFSGVRVSNGKSIVKTNDRGEWSLPIDDDSIIFVIKPRGYRTPLNDQNLPKFFYIHKPQGSPKLKFPGVKPTGPLPHTIDFPLYPQNEPESFQVLLFGDPQPRNDREVDYIAHDVIEDLIGTKAAFGVTLGDIVFDDLKVFESLNQTVAMIGIPWYNVIGNHDVNYDTTERQYCNETYESIYGPSYYSFDYGQVHFVVMDNIDWETKPDGRAGYVGNFGEQQLDFLQKDLELCPENQMVVLMMHVPLKGVKDHPDLFRLIEKRSFCISISGHTHTHEHVYFDKNSGWNGEKPHHHIVNVTVSGSWWSGKKDERGIPHTTMADGGPNGCSRITFNGQQYVLDYLAAGVDRGRQMRIQFPTTLPANDSAQTPVYVNVFDGSLNSVVKMRIDGNAEWLTMDKVAEADPFFVSLYAEDQATGAPNEPRLNAPGLSSHLWKGKLTTDLTPGVHLIEVSATDSNGRTHVAHRSVRVSDKKVVGH